MLIVKHDKSHIVDLEDGSRWRIWPGDIAATLQWLPTTELEVLAIDHEFCTHALTSGGPPAPGRQEGSSLVTGLKTTAVGRPRQLIGVPGALGQTTESRLGPY